MPLQSPLSRRVQGVVTLKMEPVGQQGQWGYRLCAVDLSVSSLLADIAQTCGQHCFLEAPPTKGEDSW